MGSQRTNIRDPLEREAVLGLWAIPGIGAVALRQVEACFGGSVRPIASEPVRSWLPLVPLREVPRQWLKTADTLVGLAALVRERAGRHDIQIVFPGDEGYPERLAQLPDAPAVLFCLGRPGVPRKRVAMVGPRHPPGGVEEQAQKLAGEVAAQGVGVISGAAVGVDRACHRGALRVQGETWAFLASGLDEIDPAQRKLVGRILEGGGRVFSEYPPGIRSKKEYFPRRNRLISGSSDAVVVIRAARGSGSLWTAHHAERQGRPILVVPDKVTEVTAAGSNELLREGRARVCLSAKDILDVLGIMPARQAKPPPPGWTLDDLEVSAQARQVLAAVKEEPQVFEKVLGAVRMDPARLVSALCELELAGLIVQHPGKLYSRA